MKTFEPVYKFVSFYNFKSFENFIFKDQMRQQGLHVFRCIYEKKCLCLEARKMAEKQLADARNMAQAQRF